MSAGRDIQEGDPHLLGQWEESPSERNSLVSLTTKAPSSMFSTWATFSKQKKEEVPGAQGQLHHKVSDLEEPPSKSISAQGDVPPSFFSYKKHPEIFYCASGTFG